VARRLPRSRRPGHPEAEALAEIERASQRGTALVRQLLTFSRRQEPTRKLTHLAPLVEDALGLLKATVSRRIQIETDFADDTPEILADATQIHQIVMNLGTNAAHAMRDRGGKLTVRVGRVLLPDDLVLRGDVLPRGSYARFVVADEGAGIDSDALDRIFDPFFTTKPAGEGTGLGLSVVHGIVRSHEGGIAVVSGTGRGTEFTIYFPAASGTPERP
jgi:signal transduction histidine kinase